MRLAAPLRLILNVLVVAAGTALVWWLLGYTLGKGILSGAAETAFRRGFGFDAGGFLRLLLIALVGGLSAAVAGGGGGKWLALAGIAFGAAVVAPDKGVGTTLGLALFVFLAAGVAEAGAGAMPLAFAAGAGVLVALAFILDGPFGKGDTVAVVALRGLLYYFPLLALPAYAEKYAVRRIAP